MKRKNYMKKIVTVLAVATMLMSSLSACGKTEDTTTDKPAAEASVETEQTSEAAGTETVAETEAVAATEENTEGEDNLAHVYFSYILRDYLHKIFHVICFLISKHFMLIL